MAISVKNALACAFVEDVGEFLLIEGLSAALRLGSAFDASALLAIATGRP